MKKRSVIAILRMTKGLSQSEFARSLGVSQQYLSQIETGFYPCSDDLLKQIAVKLGADYLELRRQFLERQ